MSAIAVYASRHTLSYQLALDSKLPLHIIQMSWRRRWIHAWKRTITMRLQFLGISKPIVPIRLIYRSHDWFFPGIKCKRHTLHYMVPTSSYQIKFMWCPKSPLSNHVCRNILSIDTDSVPRFYQLAPPHSIINEMIHVHHKSQKHGSD